MPRPASSSAPRHSCPPVVLSSALQLLHKISHVKLTDFQKIDGVKYYVVNIYEKPSRRRAAGSATRRLSDFALTSASADGVATALKPAFRVVKRFRDFEDLRKQLQRSMHGTKKNGECSCCDAFSTFLSCRSMQPGLLTKLTKGDADRKVLLEQFINQVIRLAVLESGASSHHHIQASCGVKDLVPKVLEQFIRATTEQKTQRLADACELPANRASIVA